MKGACNGKIPPPWGPGEGSKGQISFNFNFKDFYMFSQMKDTKHIRPDFNSVAWVMPQGSDSVALGVPRGSDIFFFKRGHVAHQIDGDDEQNRMQVKFSS